MKKTETNKSQLFTDRSLGAFIRLAFLELLEQLTWNGFNQPGVNSIPYLAAVLPEVAMTLKAYGKSMKVMMASELNATEKKIFMRVKERLFPDYKRSLVSSNGERNLFNVMENLGISSIEPLFEQLEDALCEQMLAGVTEGATKYKLEGVASAGFSASMWKELIKSISLQWYKEIGCK